jgi:acyl-CoA dehydrogenase
MRWIGVSQRALDLTAARMLERESFGARLADHQMLQAFLADSAMDLYAARLMVLHAAWRVDEELDHRQEIAMLKTFVAEAFGRILDRAVQVYGGAGITHDHPIAQWYADARAARIYDGASEVHRVAIARRLLRLAQTGESTRPACGSL